MRSFSSAIPAFCRVVLPLTLVLPLVTGCGIGTPAPPNPVAIPTLRGNVMGGQQPLAGTTIRLYAVGALGNGSPALDILGTGTNGPATSVSSGTDGSFTISGDYTCPALAPSTPVYLAATGGNPGLTPSVDNTAIALVAALGPCDTLLANASTTYITINEATTAAAAWALAPFATSLTTIGASSTNLAGITQAFAISNQLVDTSPGTSPNAAIASYSLVESAKLYSLADILASCVNSTGIDGQCATLFNDAKPGATAPTDTFAAALDIVQNPANNVSQLYGLIPSSPPFVALTSAPADWTMTITYSEASGTASPLSGATIRTIDQEGKLWGSYQHTNIAKFSPQLAPLLNFSLANLANSGTSPHFNDVNQKTGLVSIDPTGNLWVASSDTVNSVNMAVVNPTGSILEFDNSGNLLSTAAGYTGGGIVNPTMALADTNGYVWVGNEGFYESGNTTYNLGADVALLSPTGAPESPSTGWNVSKQFFAGLTNFDSLHNAWVSDPAFPQLLIFPPLTAGTGASTPAPATIISLPSTASDIVFDTLNNGWFAMSGALGEVYPTQLLGSTSITGSGLISPSELAVDASNRIWTLNLDHSLNGGYCPKATLAVFSGGTGGGAPLSPIALGSDVGGCLLLGPEGFLIDNAGSVLVDDVLAKGYLDPSTGAYYGQAGLTRFVGLATPTKTPNTGPPQTP